jgi:GNAT superfamily N-acetyltransferase
MDGRKCIERMVKKDPESIIIAVDGTKIVGGAYFVDVGFIAMLFRLYVIPEYKKQGIGKMLIDEVNKRAKKRKIKSVHFVAKEEYVKLVRWYETTGAHKGNVYRWMWYDL